MPLLRRNIDKPFWSFDVKESLSLLETNKKGLTIKEVKKRIKRFGKNELSSARTFSRTKIFLRQFYSPLIFILIMAGVLTIILEGYIDSAVIFLAVAVNTALGFYQENRAEESLERLRSYIKKKARVIRDGKETRIDASQLVPGDIIYLGYGNRVPADARLISIEDLSIDESILTGESMPITKQIKPLSGKTVLPERKNMVFGGTLVVEGFGYAVVTATGRATGIGKIAESVAQAKRGKTPLQKGVAKLAWFIAGIATILVGGIFALGIMRGESIFEMFLVSAAVAVGTVPEALPIALTVILAVGVEQLVKRKGIVRNLSAAETLGSTTVIMTDKTGTLTKADMKLVGISSFKNLVFGKFWNKQELKKLTVKEKEILRFAVLSTDVLVENPKDKAEDWEIVGKSLEANIFKSSVSYSLNPIDLKKKTDHHLIIPFSSQNKFSATFVCSNKKRGQLILMGAPDMLLNKAKISKKDRQIISKRIEKLSNSGKRLLGIGTLPITGGLKSAKSLSVDDIKNIKFTGLLSFFDPIRPGVPSAVKAIQDSGVKVIMATGDLKGTALSVAKGLGWKVAKKQVLTGEEIQLMGDKELLKLVLKTKVFARVTPDDKLRIGKLLKQKGEIVGMTGDGVNDTPLLKTADIGIAVGSGSDVAKDTADLVLLDDNFETITSAIGEGRRILGNIRKAFVYLMADSLDEVFLIGGALVIGLPLPLTALQIIWVNFFTESLPALSFAFDNFVDQKEKKRKEGVLNQEVKVLTLGIGLFTSLLLFALYWFLIWSGIEIVLARTFLFACFASYTLFLAFSLRSLKRPLFSYNVFSNHFLSLSVILGIILIAVTIYIPFLQGPFGTTYLPMPWLGWVGIWVVVNIGLVEAVKLWYRRR